MFFVKKILILFVGEDLIAPCHCRGTQKYVHRCCLDYWRKTKVFEFDLSLKQVWFFFSVDPGCYLKFKGNRYCRLPNGLNVIGLLTDSLRNKKFSYELSI